MVIPHQELQPETLRALIEDFVSRDGAIQGHSEASLEQKVSTVMTQLRNGSAVVVYDAEDETCSIIEKRSLSTHPRPVADESADEFLDEQTE